MTNKKKIKAIIQQYANNGEILLEESYAKGEHASTTGYWEGYTDCAKLLLKEIDSLQEEPKPKKCMFTLEEFTEEDRKVLCEDCDDDCEYAKKYISEDYANELIDKWYKYASWRNSKHEGVLNAYGDFIERDDIVEMVTHIIKWYNEYGKGNQL